MRRMRVPRPLLIGAALFLVACGGGKATSSGPGGSATSSSSSGTHTGGAATASSSGVGGTAGAGGSGGPSSCTDGGAEIQSLPGCATPDTNVVAVPGGCTPTVDGTLHAAEWADGACFNVMGTGGMVVVVKYSGDSLYMATSGPPTCGCPMQFYFEPLGGQNFGVQVFDDPVGKDGDRSDFTLTATGLMLAPMPDSSIVTACPGNMPTPIRYEWRIPLTKLGVPPGLPGQFQMAITHSGANWPTALAVNTSMHATFQNGEPTWGALKSSSWH
jgi:hypothetical protein